MQSHIAIAITMIIIGSSFLSADHSAESGPGREVKWSPAENKYAFIRNDSIFIVAGDSEIPTAGIAVGPVMRYEWLNDSCFLIQQREERRESQGILLTDRILQICLDGSRTDLDSSVGIVGKDDRPRLSVRKLANGNVGYFDDATGQQVFRRVSPIRSYPGSQSSTELWVATDGTRSAWGKVWLYYGADGLKRRLTLSENDYLLPRLAPTNDKFTCSASRGDLVVFDTLGNELANLGRVDYEVWSPDGNWIAFCETKWTEFDIAGSDVCIAKYDGSQRRNLTNTPDITEVEPAFSSDGSKLTYRNYRSGKIVLIELKTP